jgi:endo-1,4-beta-xylanase
MAMFMLLTSAVSSPGQTVGEPALKEAFKDCFLIGAALGREVAGGQDVATRELVARQFNTVTSTNMLKWGPFNPKPGEYNHDLADRYVAFGREQGMYVVGHVLFWHNQTPNWVFEDEAGKPLTRAALLERMRQRVRHVAERYGEKIDAWDVVNESILDNGKLRDSEWTKIIGDDFIEQAFRIADEELPKSVELIYNDYSMTDARKRDAVVKMVRDLKAKGVRIDGVGMQGHWSLGGPSIKAIEEAIEAFAAAGVAVHITELDIDVLPRKAGMWGGADVRKKLAADPAMDPYRDGLPDQIQQKLAKRYAELFALFLKHQDKIKRVTFWGTTDRHSWLNHWPIKGRTNYPLLFDRQGRPKPAFDAVMKVASQTRTPAGEGYRLVWADEFDTDGPPNPKNWKFERGFVRNQELQWYQPDNAFCKDGRLIIEGRRERKPNPNYKEGSDNWKTKRKFIEYTSSCVKTKGLHDWSTAGSR